MTKFFVKGTEFEVPELFSEGHEATEAEAKIINKVVEKSTRAAILSDRIQTRAEAVEFSKSDEALNENPAKERRVSLEDLLEDDEKSE